MSGQSSWDVSNEEADALASVFRLLSRMWSVEPDETLVALLREPQVKTAYESVGGDLSEIATATDDTQLMERLACDYCQLFIGPKDPLSLHQSVWEEGRLDGAAARGVRAFSEMLGLSLEPFKSTMPDHLGVQLWIMADILARYRSVDPTSSQRDTFVDMAETFSKRHLDWSDPLFAQGVERAETNYFRSLIHVTNGLLSI